MTEDAFIYKDFVVAEDSQTVNFNYAIRLSTSEYNLTETLKFPVSLKETTSQKASLRALHIALGVSYYKIFVSPIIQHPYDMDQSEADFWNDVWVNGLGEFLYVNKLPVGRIAKFKPQSGILIRDAFDESTYANKAILGIGGGKDSIVAGELMKECGIELNGFVMATGEQLGQAKAVADTMGVALAVVERNLDKQLLELQEMPDAHKGHIPISLIFGLVGAAIGIANSNAYVVVANEASSSLPRIKDNPVNHQWSKSYKFEQSLQKFIKGYISTNLTYFSAVRPLTSVAIAKIFANYSQYFEVFTSDNYVFRIDPAKRPNSRWSLESPKSLSSFILLAPWLNEVDMLRTFGRNFLNETSLERLFLELTGQSGHPPLDCVGTVEELVLSLNLIAKQYKFSDSHLIKLALERKIIDPDKDWKAELSNMLVLQSEQAFPITLEKNLEASLRSKLI
jgi:hypothetical protein